MNDNVPVNFSSSRRRIARWCGCCCCCADTLVAAAAAALNVVDRRQPIAPLSSARLARISPTAALTASRVVGICSRGAWHALRRRPMQQLLNAAAAGGGGDGRRGLTRRHLLKVSPAINARSDSPSVGGRHERCCRPQAVGRSFGVHQVSRRRAASATRKVKQLNAHLAK